MIANLLIISLAQFVIIFFLNKIAHSLDLLDYPSKRKKHPKPTPFVGGLTISLTYCLIIFITDTSLINLKIFILCSLVVSVVGLIDDKFDINPILKLLLQSIPVYFLIDSGIFLQDLGNYEYFNLLQLGSFGKYFTFLCCLLIMNAFNYSDGIDGLLSTLFINIFLVFIILCYLFDKNNISEYLLYLIIPIIIFLLFNFSILKLPKIFLGDSGSLMLGFITGFMMIILYIELKIHPSILIWPVAFIIYEFLSTNVLRFYNKKNLFKSGSDHIHYQIKKKFNLKILSINIYLNLISIVIAFFGVLIYFLFGALHSLLGFVLFFLFYLTLKYKFLST